MAGTWLVVISEGLGRLMTQLEFRYQLVSCSLNRTLFFLFKLSGINIHAIMNQDVDKHGAVI